MQMDDPRETALQFASRVGLTFSDPSLLSLALTHPSHARESGGSDNQRLEFLGDSVIGLIVAHDLYSANPDRPEGDLTRMKVEAVRGRTLAAAAKRLDLARALVMGHGADITGDRERDSVLEAAFEALTGAVFLDQGMEPAAEFVREHLAGLLGADALDAAGDDPKNVLQEATQADGIGLPVYRITGRSGPVHEPVFAAEVEVAGKIVGRGEGRSKQAAQKDAAKVAVEALYPRG